MDDEETRDTGCLDGDTQTLTDDTDPDYVPGTDPMDAMPAKKKRKMTALKIDTSVR